ncbi:hypothetical protein ACFV5E_44155 [Streptomyces chartreusis]|uniref:hypothetical protein n=1 Tax=Streptomyces chartreusis TaxID=1969 RepID=UPI0036C38DDC
MNERSTWPTNKLTALRLGRRLIAEVAASRPGRRAFVEITPKRVTFDEQAAQEGWVRSNAARSFRLEHWEYNAERIDAFDYDMGAVQVRAASAKDEAALEGVLAQWGLRPDGFDYPWATDDPR